MGIFVGINVVPKSTKEENDHKGRVLPWTRT